MTQPKPNFAQALKSFLMWFCFFYLVFWGISQFTARTEKMMAQPVMIKLEDSRLVTGQLAHFTLHNESEKPIQFTSPCQEGEAGVINVHAVVGENQTDNILKTEHCESHMIPSFRVEPGAKHKFDLRYFSRDTFQGTGQYQLKLKVQHGEEPLEVISPTFGYSEPGVIRKLFRAIVSKPLFNLLVGFIKVLPNHSLGLAIILLTLVVRIILFIPNQKAMKSQFELQKLQPKMAELKEKHKGNPQVMAMKTMELYKTHQISPFGSLLPILGQFPFLIGTYLIIADGVSPHLDYLLYSFNQADLSIVNNLFLWLNLDQIDPYYILPVVVAGIQYITMRYSFARQKKNPNKPKNNAQEDMAQTMQKTMTWMMPLMIGGFTAFFPSGIGVYWFTSTLFGAIQQKLVRDSIEKSEGELEVVKRVGN